MEVEIMEVAIIVAETAMITFLILAMQWHKLPMPNSKENSLLMRQLLKLSANVKLKKNKNIRSFVDIIGSLMDHIILRVNGGV